MGWRPTFALQHPEPKATTFLLPVLIAASLSAPCDHAKGTGDVVKKTVPVGSFHGILVEGAIDVEVTPGTAQQVEIEAQANLIELVTTDVRNGIWTIGTGEKGYSTDKPFVVHITVPSIDRVAIEGSGEVKALGAFTADEVELSVQGSGDLSWTTDAKSIKTNGARLRRHPPDRIVHGPHRTSTAPPTSQSTVAAPKPRKNFSTARLYHAAALDPRRALLYGRRP